MNETRKIANGTPVMVRTFMGTESGIIHSSCNPAQGEQVTYLIRFTDATYSHFPADRVSLQPPALVECPECDGHGETTYIGSRGDVVTCSDCDGEGLVDPESIEEPAAHWRPRCIRCEWAGRWHDDRDACGREMDSHLRAVHPGVIPALPPEIDPPF